MYKHIPIATARSVSCAGQKSHNRTEQRTCAHCLTCALFWAEGQRIQPRATWQTWRHFAVMDCKDYLPVNAGGNEVLSHGRSVNPLKRGGWNRMSPRVTRRNGKGLSMALNVGVALMVSLCGTAAAQVCDWNNPGSNPTTVDPMVVIDKMTMFTQDERDGLKFQVGLGIIGRPVYFEGGKLDGGNLTPLGMSFGAGHLCVGQIDTAKWTPGRVERCHSFEHGRASATICRSCNNVIPAINQRALQPVDQEAVRQAIQQAYRGKTLFAPDLPVQLLPAPGPGFKVNAVPEPASSWLALLALAAVLWFRKRGR